MDLMATLYPIGLQVRGRRCVVIGGGAVGERRARALLEAGADVNVVAPRVTDTLGALIRDGGAAHVEATFRPEHLDGAFLVIAATDRHDVNAQVVRVARARGVLASLAAPADGDEEGGDFVTMAAVRRGDLLLALTTGGAGPALSARLKREMEERFGESWGPYVALLGEMRELVKQRYADEPERATALRRLAALDDVRDRIAAGDAEGARAEALAACLS